MTPRSLRHRITRQLRYDPADDIGHLLGETGNGTAAIPIRPDFLQPVSEIHIRGDDGVNAVRIFAERLGYRIFERSDAGAFQLAVHIDADDGRIAHHDAVSAFHAWNLLREELQMRGHLLRTADLFFARRRLLRTDAVIILRRG